MSLELIIKTTTSVYEPSDDSYLLVAHSKALKGKILEIGCGSGIVSLSNAFENPKNTVLGIDVNPDAVKCASENAKLNKIKNAKFMESDLFSELDKKEKFDFILFNPPYLPTKKEDRVMGKLNLALDGGRSGRRVLDRFLEEFEKYLKPRGQLLLIHSSLNNHKKTIKILDKKKFKVEILETKSFFFEKLYLLKAIKT